jgi:hypothetical protein
VGVQPVLTHVPPNSLRSMIATFIPAALKRPARGGPACPVPTMIASYAFDINRSFLTLLPRQFARFLREFRRCALRVHRAEISRLPDLHGFLVTGGHQIVQITVPYQEMPVVREPFVWVPQ